jgi:hypothetical protein
MDWNAEPGGKDLIATALLPKDDSTNPATDVLEATSELPRDRIETQAEADAGRRRRADRLARFKSSLDPVRFDRTSSYAPSIVGYYGTSRLLGGIAEVTPAVWRTMDLRRHARVAEMGSRLTGRASRIVRTLWQTFHDADVAGGPKSPLTYTSDGLQVYGALIPNVSGDEKDTSIDTAAKLAASDRYARLTDPAPIARLAGPDLASAAGTIVPMQGVAEMLILDAILVQTDRLSGANVSYIPYVYFRRDDGSVGSLPKKEYEKAKAKDPASVPKDVVDVRKLFLNDVDAGLKNSPRRYQAGVQFRLLSQIAHLSPRLYARLIRLKTMVGDPAFEAFAKTEWRFTDDDYARYRTMVGVVARLLHDRCTAGQLRLDLDVEQRLAGRSSVAGEGCDPR